jgi:hypothetical protein
MPLPLRKDLCTSSSVPERADYPAVSGRHFSDLSATSRQCLRRLISCFLICLLAVCLPKAALAQTTNVHVAANVAWVDTGIILLPGDGLTISAEGGWSNGGEQPQNATAAGFDSTFIAGTELPGAPLAALIGRIGTNAFMVGRRLETAAGDRGRLLLGMNDVQGTYDDNFGALVVTIHVVRNPVRMLDFVSSEYSFARAAQEIRSLTLGIVDKLPIGSSHRNDPAKAGMVIEQFPPAGTDLRTVKDVVLTVSDGPEPLPPIAMPDFVGSHSLLAQAQQVFGQLQTDTLVWQVHSTHRHDSTEFGTVIEQFPPTGTDLRTVKEVALTISMGPEAIPRPNPIPDIIATAILLAAAFFAQHFFRRWRWSTMLEMETRMQTDDSATDDDIAIAPTEIQFETHLELGEAALDGSISINEEKIGTPP